MLQTLRAFAGRPSFHLAGTCGALVASCLLVFAQVRSIHQLKDEALPTMAALPALTARLTALDEQVELMELQRLLSTGDQDEVIRAFVLPDGPEVERLLAQLEIMTETLRAQGVLMSVSPVQIGKAEIEGELQSFPIDVEMQTTQEGKDLFLGAVRLSGLLTVSDALPADETAMLLRLTEKENPAGIAALEQHFLSVDLLRYARDPQSYENRLMASFPSESFADSFQAVRSSGVLSDARRLLGGKLGDLLDEQNLWPMRLLDIENVSVREIGNGEVMVKMRLKAYSHS